MESTPQRHAVRSAAPAVPRLWAFALALCWLIAGRPALATPLAFEVSFTPEVRSSPFTGRILVFSGPAAGPEPRFGPDWFHPQPFYAIDVRGLAPGETVRIDRGALGFPAPPGEIPTEPTRFQAVLDQAPDTFEIGTAGGNGISDPVAADSAGAWVRLTIDHLIPPRKFVETDQVKLVELPSPRLTRFYHRPVSQRAAVLLPEGYDREEKERYPVLYVVPGFGGTLFEAPGFSRFWPELTASSGLHALVVLLDPTAHTGHHVFADSANNGPVGTALVKELVPEIDRRFRTLAHPSQRLLAGHSSGGWSTLWLQCTYPETFGGVWATSPDPVDFRDFQRVDVYARRANLFHDADGKLHPLARAGDQPLVYYQAFSDMETVLGHGGQLQSFEAVFSPRGDDGQPKPLYDRASGAVDPAVARAWRKYDISRRLVRDWKRLGPKLNGKLHVYTGEKDTFYLEGAVRLLKDELARLGSDASVEVVPGKNHFTLLDASMRARMVKEMKAGVHREGSGTLGAGEVE